MKRIFRTVQFAANIAILLLAPLVATFVIREFFYATSAPQTIVDQPSQDIPKPTAPRPPASPIGKVMPVVGVDWKNSRKTLVLYLSTTCKYCNESVPFYQRLLKDVPKGEVKVISFFSQPIDEAKIYLDQNKIKVDEVRNESLRSIGVTATPTILIVNENGIVSNHWRGKLNQEKEAEVQAQLEE